MPLSREQAILELARQKESFLRLSRLCRMPAGMPTQTQLGVLFVLDQEGAQSIKMLSAQFGMTSSAATQLVDTMVSEQLVERLEDPGDRRRLRIVLTALGRKRIVQAKKIRLAFMTTLYETLTDQELQQFVRLQTKISDRLQQWPNNATSSTT